MPLDETTVESVGFIIGDTVDARTGRETRGPVGTGFLVGLGSPYGVHGYLVTAAHVVRDQEAVTFRITTKDNETVELPVREWIYHPKVDLAVSPFAGAGRRYSVTSVDPGEQRIAFVARLGAPVYYVGLFWPIEGMSQKARPMVRSGTLSAHYQRVMIKEHEGEFTGHLIDCRSYEGFSGSPCWVEFEYPGITQGGVPFVDFIHHPDAPPVGEIYYSIMLIGMLVAHYNDPSIKEESAYGIAVILPAERILEVLMSDEMEEQREQENNRRKKGLGPPPEVSLDETSRPARYRRQDFMHDLEKVTEPEQRDEAE